MIGDCLLFVTYLTACFPSLFSVAASVNMVYDYGVTLSEVIGMLCPACSVILYERLALNKFFSALNSLSP